jgi:hypothetical protein
MSIEEV